MRFCKEWAPQFVSEVKEFVAPLKHESHVEPRALAGGGLAFALSYVATSIALFVSVEVGAIDALRRFGFLATGGQ